jgi:Na+/H+ antiporter NhaC
VSPAPGHTHTEFNHNKVESQLDHFSDIPVKKGFNLLGNYPWLSVFPAIVAIGGALWMKNVYLSLIAAILFGNLVLADGNIIEAMGKTMDEQFVRQFAPTDGATGHILIVLFTLGTGAAVELLKISGGAEVIMHWISRYARTREHGQIATWFMGCLIFFDDYANSMIVGTVARPLTDRLKISREKLAYLVDTTSAPVAGVVIVSTWVGIELSYMQEAYQAAGLTADTFSIFLATIPYRFYAWLALIFAFGICWTGRDFGPMFRAEQQALITSGHVPAAEPAQQSHLWQAISFLLILLVFVCTAFIGIAWTGLSSMPDELLHQNLQHPFSVKMLVDILNNCNSNLGLLWAATLATFTGVIILKWWLKLDLETIFQAIFQGMGNMLAATAVMVLAWGIASVCDEHHLKTASFLSSILDGRVNTVWIPLAGFLLSSAISFSTGSSWSTMGILIPLMVPITNKLLAGAAGNSVDPFDPILINVVGSILAGSIMGDHCSPISDTTVLSSAACQCPHLAHVRTQIPYALVVAMVTVVGMYIPVAFGCPLSICYLLSIGIMLAVIYGLGHKPQVPDDRVPSV